MTISPISLLRTTVLVAILPTIAAGQPAQEETANSGRSLDLGTLQQAALDTDPRMRQLQLLVTQSELRLRNISAQRLPAIAIDSQAQYQSDVAHLVPPPPGIGTLFSPPEDTYDAGIRVE